MNAVLPFAGAAIRAVGAGSRVARYATTAAKYGRLAVKSKAVRALVASAVAKGAENATKHDSKRRRTNAMMAPPQGRTVRGRRGKTVKRKHKGKNQTTLKDCLSKGFAFTTEITGAVNDPNCVYLCTQSYTQVGLVEVAVASILRKLFHKGCGWTAESFEERIPGYNGYVNDSDGWRIELYSQDRVTGTYSVYAYDLGTAETMRTLVGDTAAGLAANMAIIMNPIKLYSSGYGDAVNTSNILEPFKLRLFAKDGNVTTFWHCVADLNLRDTICHFMSHVRFRMQNRTVSDSGLSITNDLTVNPISGKVFDFTNGHPKTRVDGTFQLEIMNPEKGVNLQRAATFSIGAQKTIPNKGIFKNCIGSKNLHMEPGQMNTTQYKHTGKNHFLAMLRKLHVGKGNGVTLNTGIGYSQLIALEDDLNYNQVQKVLVVYECIRTMGCYVTTAKGKPSQVAFTQTTQNDTT